MVLVAVDMQSRLNTVAVENKANEGKQNMHPYSSVHTSFPVSSSWAVGPGLAAVGVCPRPSQSRRRSYGTAMSPTAD